MSMVAITKAEWDLRPKTKFIRVDGMVMGESFDDIVEIERAEPQGINPAVLLLNASLLRSGGPVKPQSVPFFFADITFGDEPWTHVQVNFDDVSATLRITKIT